jgi:hypothetical protein
MLRLGYKQKLDTAFNGDSGETFPSTSYVDVITG